MRCIWCGRKLTGRQKKYCGTNCRTYVAVKVWRRKTKLRAVEYKGGKCERCGYRRSLRALIFHHPGRKSFGIGNGAVQSWKRILKEITKCELLCLNCHAEEHDEQDVFPDPRDLLPPPEPKHGEYNRYRRGCRCKLCRKANAQRMKKYYKTRP